MEQPEEAGNDMEDSEFISQFLIIVVSTIAVLILGSCLCKYFHRPKTFKLKDFKEKQKMKEFPIQFDKSNTIKTLPSLATEEDEEKSQFENTYHGFNSLDILSRGGKKHDIAVKAK